ncbi:MAG: hypothetical protein ACI9I0_002450, partial [Rhodoferax sp.]
STNAQAVSIGAWTSLISRSMVIESTCIAQWTRKAPL